MPWFHRKTDEERQQEDQQQRRLAEEQELQQASLTALQRGGIPIQAQRRLDDLRQRESSFFTSDLTVNEFLLARQSGLQPLTQVMGSSIYHVGWQRFPVYYGSQELEVISGAYNHARALALGRMTEEAERVGAHAVVGVHVTRAAYDWAEDLIEFNTVGTAVRLPGGSPSGRPGLTNLSGQDFWKLHQAGYWPLGVVAASTVFYVVASWQTQRANSWWGSRQNQELGDFTQGLYVARHLAMRHVRSQAEDLQAKGIVGMEIEQAEREYEVNLGNDQERTDMIFTFHAIGTAITELSGGSRNPPMRPVVNLRA
ncbi:MAG: heavy metal-binding domain-containing protein [Chloroflexi bacterium]|nr:heavy metal-binding domain-containing protein [Chloroflexota bacterium]